MFTIINPSNYDGSCIYFILNTSNGKRYIGSTRNFEKRLKSHRNDLKNNKHQNHKLQEDFNKGNEFIASILDIPFTHLDLDAHSQSIMPQEAPVDLLSSLEGYYIRLYRTFGEEYGYNLKDVYINNIDRFKMKHQLTANFVFNQALTDVLSDLNILKERLRVAKGQLDIVSSIVESADKEIHNVLFKVLKNPAWIRIEQDC